MQQRLRWSQGIFPRWQMGHQRPGDAAETLKSFGDRVQSHFVSFELAELKYSLNDSWVLQL